MITERILQVLKFKEITKYKFCRDLGLSNGFLDKPREITTDKYAKILVYFIDINPEWLLTGEGPMLKTDTYNKDIYNKVSPPPAPSESNSQIELLKEQLKEKDAEIKALNREIGKLQEQLAASKKTSIPYNTDRGTYQAMVAEPPVEYEKKA